MVLKSFVVDAHPDGIPNSRTGTAWTASFHLFCGIVGSGILALPASFKWLGWVAGPICMLLFYAVTLLTSWLLIDLYEISGHEHGRYQYLVQNVMGVWGGRAAMTSQLLYCLLLMLQFTISPAIAMKRIATLACEYQGIAEESCWNSTWKLTLLFGAFQIPVSLIPDFEALAGLSLFGVITSFGYCLIGIGLGLHYSGNRLGSVGGISAPPAQKAFGVLNALGTIALAYTITALIPEIQHTLKQPPKAAKTMHPAASGSITLTLFFYMIMSIGGYAALGDDTPGFVLNGFDQAPKWVLIMANLFVLLHLSAAYEVFAAPVFNSLELAYASVRDSWWRRRAGGAPSAPRAAAAEGGASSDSDVDLKGAPEVRADEGGFGSSVGPTDLRHADGPADPPPGGRDSAQPGPPQTFRRESLEQGLARLSRQPNITLLRASRDQGAISAIELADAREAGEVAPTAIKNPAGFWERLVLRTLLIIAITVIACCLPFFTDMAGLIGALTFFPLTVFFPIECYRRVYKPRGVYLYFLYVLQGFMALISLAAIVGSIRGIVVDSQNYTVFGD